MAKLVIKLYFIKLHDNLILLKIASSYKYKGSSVSEIAKCNQNKINKRKGKKGTNNHISYGKEHKAYYKSSLCIKTKKEQNKLSHKSVIIHLSIRIE